MCLAWQGADARISFSLCLLHIPGQTLGQFAQRKPIKRAVRLDRDLSPKSILEPFGGRDHGGVVRTPDRVSDLGEAFARKQTREMDDELASQNDLFTTPLALEIADRDAQFVANCPDDQIKRERRTGNGGFIPASQGQSLADVPGSWGDHPPLARFTIEQLGYGLDLDQCPLDVPHARTATDSDTITDHSGARIIDDHSALVGDHMDQSVRKIHVGLIDTDDESRAESRGEGLIESRDRAWVRVGSENDACPTERQHIEDLEQLMLRGLFPSHQVDVVNAQQIEIAVFLLKRIHGAVADRFDESVRECLAGGVADLCTGAELTHPEGCAAEEMCFPHAARAMDKHRDTCIRGFDTLTNRFKGEPIRRPNDELFQTRAAFLC